LVNKKPWKRITIIIENQSIIFNPKKNVRKISSFSNVELKEKDLEGMHMFQLGECLIMVLSLKKSKKLG